MMPPRNYRRGSKRILLVLGVIWAVYCLIVFPFQQREKARDHYLGDLEICWAQVADKPLMDCVHQAQGEWQTRVDQWSIKNYYIAGWWLLLLVILLPPTLVYWTLIGLARLVRWVYGGFDRR